MANTDDDALTKLTQLLRRLGHPTPDLAAQSELGEGIPQTGIFVLLNQAWARIASEEDLSWIEEEEANAAEAPGNPFSGAGLALARLREKGASNEELAHLVRAMQAEAVLAVVGLLDQGDEGIVPEAPEVRWGVFMLNDDGAPAVRVRGLHESFLVYDPTGRDMRPPKGWTSDS